MDHLRSSFSTRSSTAPTFGRKANPAINTEAEPAVAFPMSALLGFKKGDELGWFSFGGSTLVMVFQKDTIDKFVVDDKTRLSAREHIATAIPIRTTKS